MSDRKLIRMLKKEITSKRDKASRYSDMASYAPKEFSDLIREMARDEKDITVMLRWAVDTNLTMDPEWFDNPSQENVSDGVIVWRPFPEESR